VIQLKYKTNKKGGAIVFDNIDKIIVKCTKKMNQYVNTNLSDKETLERLKKEILELKKIIYEYESEIL